MHGRARGGHEADTTKGGYADVLPIPDGLQPYLEAAIRLSPSDLVFRSPMDRCGRGTWT